MQYHTTFHNHRPNSTSPTVALIILLLGLFTCLTPNPITAQTTNQSPSQVTIEGTISMYKVTRYGDSIQEIDRYRKTNREGEYVAFILKADEKMDVTQYIETEEELKVLVDNAESDETMQSEFLFVPNRDVFKSFSERDFASQFAHKRVRVIGHFFVPLFGWHNITPVAMRFTKVEVVD